MKMNRNVCFFALLALCRLLQAQTLYWGGGASDIADGTSLPVTSGGNSGTWNATLSNWSNAYSPTDYEPWVNGSFVNWGYFTGSSDAAVTFEGHHTISGMFATLTGATGTNRRYGLNNATGTHTLTLSGSEALFLIGSSDSTRRVELNTGNANISFGSSSTKLVKDGGGALQLGSSGGVAFNGNAFTGDVLIRAGTLNVANTGSSLNGTTKIDVIGYRPSLNYGDANGNQGFVNPVFSFTNGSGNQLNDNLVINLTRGIFTINPNASGSETIGTLAFQGAGILNVSNTTGAGGVLNINTLSRGADGRGTGVVQVSSGDALTTSVRITTPGSIPTNTLLPWLSTSRGEWLQINSSASNELQRVVSTAAATDATIWDTTYDATSNIRVGATLTGALDANTTVNSLGFISATTLDLGGNTLTLNSGALGHSGINVTINNGTIQTPGSTPLYINGGWSNSGTLTLQAVLTGSMDIYYTGQNTMNLSGSAGANTYNGTFYIQSGTVQAGRAGAINGPVVVNTGAGLQIGNVNGIAAGANITVQKDGLLTPLNSTANLSGTVTLNGGVIRMGTQSLRLSGTGTGFAFNGGVINSAVMGTTGRQLELMTNVSYASTSESQAIIQWTPDGAYTTAGFNVQLSPTGGPATRTFDIADSTLHNKAEMWIDVPIVNGAGTAPVGSLVKEGAGVLQLTANNTYTGTTTVNGGTLHLARIQAAAQTGLTGTYISSSGIDAQVLTFVAPITGSMAVGQTVTGTGIAANRVISGILNDYQVILSNTVGSSGSVSTDIALGAVDRAGQLASATTVNSGGTLLMDTGTSVNNTVTVNSGGILVGTGTITGATAITGSLRPGHSIGTKTVTNDVTWNSSTLATDAWVFELGTAASSLALANSGGSTQDLLNITGATSDFLKGTTGGSWLFDFANTGAEGWYKLVDWAGTTTFSASDFSYINLASGLTASFVVDTGSGSTEALYLNVIPEPGVTLLIALGALFVVWQRCRRAA